MIITSQQENKILFYWDNKKYLGYAYKEVDGFYVFVFNTSNAGSWSDYALRSIADKITELNKEWDSELDKYFGKAEPKEYNMTCSKEWKEEFENAVANQNEKCICEVGHPYNNLTCPVHGSISNRNTYNAEKYLK